METVISAKSKTAVIGPDRPFTIIGERINPTGRKVLAQELAAGNFNRVEQDALAQVAAGAHILDVNAGIPLIDEPAVLAQIIQIVQSITDAPLSIDSSMVEALRRGLEVYQGKALVNSVTGEEDRLEAVLPLVKKHGAAVIAICNDETGISQDPDARFAVAQKIIQRAQDHGIAKEDVIIDPLIFPIGAVPTAGRQVFHLLRRIREELGVNTTGGGSNISFGLPNRVGINAHFLSMAIAYGLTSAITNPIEARVKEAVLAADMLMGHDENCLAWIGANRTVAAGEGTTAVATKRPRPRPTAR
jgi:5-methyltetrahydrofolate--homocysteine methyltransferase